MSGDDKVQTGEYFESTSPSRDQNVMRHKYRKLSEEEAAQMDKIKDMGADFWDFIDSMGESRELSLAKTHIEDAVMRAVKHVTR